MDNEARRQDETAAYFATAETRFREAAERVGTRTLDIVIAGHRLRIVVAGEALETPFTRALAHAAIPTDSPGEPSAEFRVWESVVSGVMMPPPGWDWGQVSHRGEVRSRSDARFRTAFHYHDHSLALFDTERRIGICWVHAAEALPYWTVASPLRTMLHWWLSAHDCQLVHGAAVAVDGEAIVLVGAGGAGKSTTALTCLAEGLDFLGDDYVVLQSSPEPRVHTLFATAKLNPQDIDDFVLLKPLLFRDPPRDGEKALALLHPALAHRIRGSARIRAIATPRIVNAETTAVVPGDHSAVKRAAVMTTLAQLPHAGEDSYQRVAAIARAVPNLAVLLGSNRAEVATAIRAFLTSPRAPEPPMSTPSDDARWPLVSVVVPTWNAAHFLPEAIANIAAQDYPNLEILVVDDGSTDHTAEVVRTLPVEVHYRHQENAGPSAARNHGLRDASADLIAFLDVDDLYAQGALKRMVAALLEDPDRDVVQGRAQLLELNTTTGEFIPTGTPDDTFPYSIGTTVSWRRVFERVGPFDQTLRYGEDTDWFGRMKEAGIRLHRIDDVTMFVRRHTTNMTRGKSLLELNMLRVFKRALDRRRQKEPDADS